MLNKLIKKELDFIEVVLLFFYYIVSVALLLGLLGYFNRWLLLFDLAVFVVAFALLRIKIKVKKYHFIALALAVFSLIGFGLLRGYIAGDATWFWLPISRTLAQIGEISTSVSDWRWIPLTRQPIFYLLIASTFSLFNTFQAFTALWIPLLFSGLTAVLLFKWAKEKGIKKEYLIFIPLLVLCNRLVAYWGWNLMQESIILFFATAFFYYYDKYLEEKTNHNLFFLAISFILATLSKVTGFFLVIPLFFAFLKSKKTRKYFIIIVVIISLPLLIWLLRNFIIFNNPVFPVLKGVFVGPYDQYMTENLDFKLFGVPELENSIHKRTVHDINLMMTAYPFILLALWGLWKYRKYGILFTLFLFFIIQETVMYAPLNADRRHYLFLGVLIIYAVLGLEKLKSKLFLLLLHLLALGVLLKTPLTRSTSQFILGVEGLFSPFLFIVDFMHNNPLAVLIIMFPFLLYIVYKKFEQSKIILLSIYCLYILTLTWIFNKSWVNTWLPILFILLFIACYAIISKYKDVNVKKILIPVVIIILLLNSWGMAIVYYINQGNINLPVSHVYNGNHGIVKYLEENETSPKDSFYIIARDVDYLIWYKNYQAMRINHPEFNHLTGLRYNENLSAEEIHSIFIASKIKYIAVNNYILPQSLANLLEKIREKPDLFKEVFVEKYKEYGFFYLYQIY
ncbi:glycosyltransferase family 39 protein [Patescibacteria group bacterium]|nr:glycosyltransferase family 39 protein [Patescibacteria group bacterium]